ncbi:hypothetical protein ACQ4LE_001388 [Meloidogyne hapla]
MYSFLATQQYINEMLRLAGPGMKLLLMDKETTTTVSCVHTQSEMMLKEVFLFERLDSGITREPIKFLKCIVFVRPTPENIKLLSDELRSPKYAQYYIYFSNIISKADLKTLADSDEQETVREVREFYADFIPLSPHFVTLDIPNPYTSQRFLFSSSAFIRCLQSLTALCLALNKKPSIRYQKTSSDAQRLAEELIKQQTKDVTLFEQCKTDAVLVILDRSEDPISPLLNQWTYEAMVHELIGMHNNRVKIGNDVKDEQKNLILSPHHDEFYSKNMYSNFGDIGQNIKSLMNDYQHKAKTHQQLESIVDMKKFVEQYPQFKKMTGTVSKHVQLVGELSRLVTEWNLLEISELEQNIAVANGDHQTCIESLKRILQHPKTTELNALRLAMLYALRFESSANNSLNLILDLLRQKGITNRNIQLVKILLEYSGHKKRQSDLFGNKSAMEMTKKFIKGLKGVENIYTQHEPYITQLIESVSRGRLPVSNFTSTDSSINSRFDEIIIFIIGGATFEESAAVARMNGRGMNLIGQSQTTGSSSFRVVLCSNYVHNTKSFISQLAQYNSGARSDGPLDLSSIP